MNAAFARSSSIVLALAVLTTFLPGCVVGDGGYGYGGVDVGANYYQPVGVGYGGWGPGYRVGPYRGGGRPYGGGGVGRPWRGSPGRGSIPSIPSGPRGGGGARGGGARGGGGGGAHGGGGGRGR